jgi:16S rRNA (guanine(966)-N(2))-methyltransferase RsmD
VSKSGQGQLRLTGGRKLRSPKGDGTRPTTARVREAVMNILAPRLRGAHWLDLCSGSGVMGCEALQRGVQRVVAIEQQSGAAAICRSNLTATASGQPQATQILVVQRDLVSWLARGRGNDDPGFDLVYFDPPYASELYSRGLDALVLGQWLRPDALVLCEHAGKQKPATPEGWRVVDQRCYGSSGVLFLSPPEHCPGGTDSKRQQTSPEG